MPTQDHEAKRKARLAQRDAERAARRAEFQQRNAAAAAGERRTQSDRAKQQDARQARIREARLARRAKWTEQNQAAQAALPPEREPRYFTNEGETAEAATPPENKDLGPGGRRAARGKLQQGAAAVPQSKATGDSADGTPDALDGVAFASPQAKQKAVDLGMTAESFKRRRKTSDHGFNVEDVQRIAETLGIEDEEEGQATGEPGA
jgi:hypothetical protein